MLILHVDPLGVPCRPVEEGAGRGGGEDKAPVGLDVQTAEQVECAETALNHQKTNQL